MILELNRHFGGLITVSSTPLGNPGERVLISSCPSDNMTTKINLAINSFTHPERRKEQ